MNHENAMQLALGYAWAFEDATGVKTAGDNVTSTSSFTFAVAFAAGWDAYNASERGSMTSVQGAYTAWQASNGRTIFQSELTDSDDRDPAVTLNAALDEVGNEIKNIGHQAAWGSDAERTS